MLSDFLHGGEPKKIMIPKILRCISCAMTVSLLAIPAAWPTGVQDPLERPAIKSSLAQQSVLLGLAMAGARTVAVGERGIVLLSDDIGSSWQQGAVPVSVSLTGVAFANAKVGWAIGHGGVVLKTMDGGVSWSLQLDGNKVLAYLDGNAAPSQSTLDRWKAEGADKPFLALQVDDEQSLTVVGAYGLAFRSQDGGSSWEYFGNKLDNPRANHLYAIKKRGKQLLIAGEQGCVFISVDDGHSFKRATLPYKGSLFELHESGKGLLASGMNGKLFFTANWGSTWQEVANPIHVSLLDAVALPDGRTLWLNQAGQLLLGGEAQQELVPLKNVIAPGATRLVIAGKDKLVTVGFRGVSTQPWKP